MLLTFLRRRLAAFRNHQRGALAPIAAITGLVLVIAAGAAVDVGRATRDRSLLQDIADSAALAGAAQTTSSAATSAATNYVNAALASMSDKPAVTATYTPSSDATYAAPPSTGVPFKVQLSATMQTTLMAVMAKSMSINVSATATSALVKKITIALTNFNSDAADTNAIYAYGYNPSSYSTTTALYKLAASATNTDGWTCVFSNKTVSGCPAATQSSVTLTIPYADNVGFALSNTTGTSVNCYGRSTGSNTMYYSTRLDSSGSYHDYPTAPINYCGYAVTSSNGDGTTTVDNYQAITVGSNYSNQCKTCEYQTVTTTYQCYWFYTCQSRTSQPPSGTTWNLGMSGDSALDYGYVFPKTSSRNPLILSSSTLDCSSGSAVTYSWDDNGGGSDANITNSSTSADDDDHNDVDFTVTCTKAVSQSGAKLTG